MPISDDWAPCAHNDKERADLGVWAAGVVGTLGNPGPPARGLIKKSENSLLEHLLWVTSDMRFPHLTFSFHSDQWVAIGVEYSTPLGGKAGFLIYGDTFTLAMARVVERLKTISEQGGGHGPGHLSGDTGAEEEPGVGDGSARL